MRKGFIFVIDAMFAALIVVTFLSFLNLNYYELIRDRVLYNYASSSMLVISDELLSEDESVIESGLNQTLPFFMSYAYEVKYYYNNLNLRVAVSGGNVSNTDVIVVNKLFWSDNGPAYAVLKVGYDE